MEGGREAEVGGGRERAEWGGGGGGKGEVPYYEDNR